MLLKRVFSLFCLLLVFSSTVAAQSTFSFPCDSELSPFLAESEHEITRDFDLAHWYRMQIDYWGDDVMMVESGSLVILDDAFMIISLRFSEEYDYEAHDTHLPDKIMLINHNPNIVNDNDPPEWLVWMYPDVDDPYSFHYACSWNWDMVSIDFYGRYTDSQGSHDTDFHLEIDM